MPSKLIREKGSQTRNQTRAAIAPVTAMRIRSEDSMWPARGPGPRDLHGDESHDHVPHIISDRKCAGIFFNRVLRLQHFIPPQRK